MAKLFIFGIGGTGSRVLRSLTMLLAAGVKFGTEEIVPIIIDPDASNGDLTRTIALLTDYNAIRNNLTFPAQNPSQFFRTAITNCMTALPFRIPVGGTNQTFENYIDLNGMSTANKAISKMLFSDNNLGTQMTDGFHGNPNIGSVTLNQIPFSKAFNDFAQQFTAGDRIFIISSIFGGTGASGFPLLLKTLRTNTTMPNLALINNAEIGAITVLPYFKVEQAPDDEPNKIDSDTLISKAKAALEYYEGNICGSVDAMYYIADNITDTYEYHEGMSEQQNNAHLIELLAATAIVDFSNNAFPHDPDMPILTTHKELGLKDGIGSTVNFASFHDSLRYMLYNPLIQFTLTANALTDNLSYYSSDTFAATKNIFKTAFYRSQSFLKMNSFFGSYKEWLTEMKNNIRSLDLFNLNCGNSPFDVVNGVTPRKVTSIHSNYDLLTGWLNSAAKEAAKGSLESHFLEMFYRGTETAVTKKF